MRVRHALLIISISGALNAAFISTSSAAAPSPGTLVSWTNNTFFDNYSTQSGVTTTDLVATNSLTWQLFYANAPLSIPADGVARMMVNTYTSGTNTWSWKISISNSQDTIGNWGSESVFATGSASYAAGGTYTNSISTAVSIPANRYFLIGIYNGPYYKSYKSLANSRSAQINGNTYFTAINKIYYSSHGNSLTAGIPSSIGGSSNLFTTYDGYALVSSIKFQATGEPISPDTTAPTFTSSNSFSAAENIATSSAAATIKVSESATVTISSGVDAALFTIANSDSVTALIKFIASPNYEAPSDSGANNVYDLVLTATDPSNNAGTQTITITVTDVLDTSSFNSLALAGGVSSVTYRAAIQINASVTVASKITFKAANVVIPGCKGVLATGSGATYTVSCSWKPSKRGGITLSATSTPTNVTISGANAAPITVSVVNRTGSR